MQTGKQKTFFIKKINHFLKHLESQLQLIGVNPINHRENICVIWGALVLHRLRTRAVHADVTLHDL